LIDDRPDNIQSARSLGWKTYHLQAPQRIRDIFTNGVLKEELNLK
jgi:FMN phosphatase YigB (HAD superfamily)